jgi:hypothetical protein
MSTVQEFTCPDCGESFLETQLRMEQVTKESCPHCDKLLRFEEGWGGTNVQLLYAEDIAAIDAWLDNHSKATGKQVQNLENPKNDRKRLWSIETDYPFLCVVEYRLKQPNIVGIGFAVEDNFDRFDDEKPVKVLAARHGLEAFGQHRIGHGQSEGESWTWGVQQRFSTNLLCEDWFEPLFRRLDAAMKEAMALGR